MTCVLVRGRMRHYERAAADSSLTTVVPGAREIVLRQFGHVDFTKWCSIIKKCKSPCMELVGFVGVPLRWSAQARYGVFLGVTNRKDYLSMTLEEISESLPNGFHDAQIKSINLDYVNREATFDLDVWLATDSSKKGEERDAYRAAQLTLSQFLFCVIEPPDPKYRYAEGKPLWVDAGSDSAPPSTSIRLPEPLPKDAFAHWFFVNNWNAFIHVAAKNARLEFLDPQAVGGTSAVSAK